MRVLLLTANGYGHALLPALRAAGHEVALAVADEPSLAATAPKDGDVVLFARSAGVAVHVVSPERGKSALARRAEKPELIVAAGFMGSLLASDVAQAPRGGFLLQPSLLPRFQGLSPESWVLIEGERETGVSAVVPRGRALLGEVVERRALAIDAQDDQLSLRAKLAELMVAMLPALVARAASGELAGEAVEGGDATHLPTVRDRDGILSFDEPSRAVVNRVRGTLAFPGALAKLGERSIRIRGARAIEKAGLELAPGLVLRASGGEVFVQTKDGAVALAIDDDDARAIAATPGAMFARAGYEVAVRTAAPTDHEAAEFGIPRGAERFPQMVVLAVAYPCNALCPNCPYTPGNSTIREWYNDTPFIARELYLKIARECGEHGAFLRITGGGEPFLHPDDMTSLIEQARALGSKVWVNTNGSIVTPDRGERLVACACDVVEFSVDAADRETYRVVRAGLDWDALLVNVRAIVAARNRARSKTRVVVSVINQDVPGVAGRMDEIAAFWSNEIGVDEVIRRKFLTWGSNTSLDALHSGDDTAYLDKGNGVPCPFPFHRLNVDARGKVEVCGYDISGRTNFGSLKEQTISEIWQGPQFTWWRRMHLERRGSEIPLCRECPDWRYRSWEHNWQKVLKKAEAKRLRVVGDATVAPAPELEQLGDAGA